MPEKQPFEQPGIHRPTICRICGHHFKGNALPAAAIVGDNPAAKLDHIGKLLKPLMEHLAKDDLHRQAVKAAQAEGGKLAGLLTINYFQCDDEHIEASRDQTRWQIFQMMRRVKITDERIEERIRQAATSAFARDLDQTDVEPEVTHWMATDLAQEIIATMRAMRDAIEETGRYAWPKFAPPQPKPAETQAETTPQV
jgi:hypothetical protein